MQRTLALTAWTAIAAPLLALAVAVVVLDFVRLRPLARGLAYCGNPLLIVLEHIEYSYLRTRL